MPRNREFFLFALGALAVTVATVLACQFSVLPAGVASFCGCTIICALCGLFTFRRYRGISRLNSYLQRLSHGERALDIRDNEEGELSILKNEIYKVTAALTEQADILAKDKKALAAALEDISHQLKTPLTAIGVMADLLDDDELPPEKKREFLSNIRVSMNRMEWLVLTLLKLARLDAGAARLKREPVLLSSIIERALSPLLIPAEVREQTITMSGQDVTVACDPEWSAEALGNILKNAVENTPVVGHIKITYGNNPLYTFVTVHDSGPGIDKTDMPNIFKRFYRGKNASKESAGIGLSMSLAVMRKQNGDIDVANDGGSMFTLKFYHSAESDKNVTGKFTD